MKVWTVKFKGYNTPDYYEVLLGRDKKEAYQNAQRLTVKKSDWDEIDWIEEDTTWKEWLYRY